MLSQGTDVSFHQPLLPLIALWKAPTVLFFQLQWPPPSLQDLQHLQLSSLALQVRIYSLDLMKLQLPFNGWWILAWSGPWCPHSLSPSHCLPCSLVQPHFCSCRAQTSVHPYCSRNSAVLGSSLFSRSHLSMFLLRHHLLENSFSLADLYSISMNSSFLDITAILLPGMWRKGNPCTLLVGI